MYIRFEILFYDESGNLLVQTSQIEVNNTVRSEYTFSNLGDIWELVLDEINYSCNKTYKIYVAVAGYRYDDALFVGDSSRRLSGPYISSEMEINLSVEHSFEFVSNDSQTHKLYCIDCNEEIDEFYHNLQYSNITSTQHTKLCTDCGESVTENHNYEGKIIDATEHSLECDCGATNGTQGHIWTSYGIGKVKCTLCEFIKILTPGEFIPIIKNKEDLEEETE